MKWVEKVISLKVVARLKPNIKTVIPFPAEIAFRAQHD
jgi:hypothetical protein